MKFRHQSALVRRAREKTGATCDEFGQMLGGVSGAFVSSCEHGKTKLTPRKFSHIKGLISKEEALDAFIQDHAEAWEEEYEGR